MFDLCLKQSGVIKSGLFDVFVQKRFPLSEKKILAQYRSLFFICHFSDEVLTNCVLLYDLLSICKKDSVCSINIASLKKIFLCPKLKEPVNKEKVWPTQWPIVFGSDMGLS